MKSLTTSISTLAVAMILSPAFLSPAFTNRSSAAALWSPAMQEQTCNFDEIKHGYEVGKYYYDSHGVIFSEVLGKKFVAVRDQPFQPPRSISPYCVARVDGGGTMIAEFFDPADDWPAATDSVSFTTSKIKGSAGRAFKGFDVYGNLVASTVVDFGQTQQKFTLSSATKLIHKVTLQMGPDKEYMDDFCFAPLASAAGVRNQQLNKIYLNLHSALADAGLAGGHVLDVSGSLDEPGQVKVPGRGDLTIQPRTGGSLPTSDPIIDQGIDTSSRTGGVTIERLTIRTGGEFGVWSEMNGHPLTVRACHVEATLPYTIGIGSIGKSPSRAVLEGNTIIGPLGVGIGVVGDGANAVEATIRGNIITDTTTGLYTESAGIQLASIPSGSNVLVENNRVEGSGLQWSAGIHLTASSGVRIKQNTVCGFGGPGIFVAESHSNQIEANTISDNVGGVEIEYRATNNRVGPSNVISGNQGAGVLVSGEPAINNRICANSIFANGDLGIDLEDGANRSMSAPVITKAETYRMPLPDGLWSYTTTFEGVITHQNKWPVTINVFLNDVADPSGSGEGQTYVGCAMAGVLLPSPFWSLTVPGRFGPWATATATDADGNTSEFSLAAPVWELYGGIGVVSGNETWPVGSQQMIRWVSSGFTGPVRIELVRAWPRGPIDNFLVADLIAWLLSCHDPCRGSLWPTIEVEWLTLFDSTPNDGTERFTVPGPPSDLCAIRITSIEDPNYWAISPQWITVTGQSDLVVNPLVVFPPMVRAGSMTLVSFSIVNQGTTEAGPASHQIRLLANQIDPHGGPPIPADVLLDTVTTGTLAAGASASFRRLVTVPLNIVPGVGMIQVVADAENAVSESNEANNERPFPISITSGPF